MARTDSPGIGKFYPATGTNLYLGALSLGSKPDDLTDLGATPLFFLGNVIDPPISLATDTIFLPADLVMMLSKNLDEKDPAPAKAGR